MLGIRLTVFASVATRLALCSLLTVAVSGCYSCRGEEGEGQDGGGADAGTDGGGGCTDGETQVCGTDEGVCAAGIQTCAAGTFGACVGEVGPGTETCDGVDNDCNGQIDEGCPCTGSETQRCGSDVGACAFGTQTCSAGAWGACDGEVTPATETCDGVLDENCDGAVDEGCGCTDGESFACGDDEGECLAGTQTCTGGVLGGCEGQVGPAGETCNDLDDDCDGVTDQGCDDDGDGYCDLGMTVTGTPGVCASGGGDCDDSAATGAAVNPGATEVCDDLDNACGGVDTGCDDDADGWCDDTMTVVGTPAICASGIGDCDDDATTGPAVNPGATEVCDDLDNDCGGIDTGCDDDADGYCDAAMTVVGTPASCASGGGDCDDDPATGGAVNPGATEVCDDLDNACGGIDTGCDDDGDGYCDASMTVVGTPAVCASGGGDCDDAPASGPPVNPGATEVCGDGVDNDCNTLVDFLDTAICPLIIADIFAWSDPREVIHGGSTSIGANIAPNDGPPTVWSRVWSVIAVSGPAACDPADVAFSAQTDSENNSNVTASFTVDTFDRLGCVYTVEVRVNGYATDTIGLRFTNRRPQIQVPGATFDGTVWRLRATPGSTPSVTASASDLDGDTPLLFDWSGAEAGSLACAPNCSSSDGTAPREATVSWGTPISPGTYALTVEVEDGFDPTPSTADLIIEVDACLWVELAGSGSGALPVDPPGGPDEGPLGNVQVALDQAKLVVGTAVCVMGDQGSGPPAIFPENLVLPSTPNSPDLLGGFDDTGAVATDRPRITVDVTPGITFEAGYDGTLEHLAIRHTSSFAASGRAVLIDVQDAAPEFVDVRANATGGDPSVALRVHDDGTLAVGSAPRVLGSSFIANVSGSTGIAIEASEGAGGVVDLLVSSSSVSASGCTGSCRALYLRSGVDATIQGNQQISASSDLVAVGIDIEGDPASPAVVVIRGNQSVNANAWNGARAIAIRLEDTDGVDISNNRTIGMWGSAGSELGVGIADGHILRDGTQQPGGSTNLSITGNDSIGGLNSWANRCVNPGDTGEGVDVAAGILLVGTSNVTIVDNGNTGDSMGGIFGGTTTVHWDATTRRLPPSAVGLWLIDTSGVQADNNEIKAGSLNEIPTCPAPLENPPAIGYRDGLPPNPNLAAGAAPPEWGSSGTRLDGNGISCARPPENGVIGSGLLTWCTAVEVNAPVDARPAPRLINNVIAGTRGNFIVGYRQRGGAGVRLYNNTIDVDLMLRPWDTPPPPGTIRKWAVLLDDVGPDALRFVNNLVYVHRDDPYDLATERLGWLERTVSGTASSAENLDSCLFYLEGDNLLVPADPYLRVTNGVTTAEYASDALNVIVGPSTNLGNFAALPGLVEYSEDWQKSWMRLDTGSAAIDAGQPVGGTVPGHDIDGDARPQGAGVDIGHDERP